LVRLVGVIDPPMLVIADIHQAAVTALAVEVDDTAGIHATADNHCKVAFEQSGTDLSLGAAIALEKLEHIGLSKSVAATQTVVTPRSHGLQHTASSIRMKSQLNFP
jgi:hypothetical protein